jgi:hypothetical protein
MSLAPQSSGIHEIIEESGALEPERSARKREQSLQTGTVPGAAPVRIQMPCGHWFIVDAEDAERVAAFKWHAKSWSASPGKRYAHRTVRVTPGRNGKKSAVTLHRWLVDAGPGQVVDHVNGNTLDNRRENLRVTDVRGNSMNVTSSKNQKRGGFKGVNWNPRAKKWEAGIGAGEIGKNGKRRRLYLGIFTDPVLAAKAYDTAARKFFGEFAACNFELEDVATPEAANLATKETA